MVKTVSGSWPREGFFEDEAEEWDVFFLAGILSLAAISRGRRSDRAGELSVASVVVAPRCRTYRIVPHSTQWIKRALSNARINCLDYSTHSVGQIAVWTPRIK